jgi:hypothetical protein
MTESERIPADAARADTDAAAPRAAHRPLVRRPFVRRLAWIALAAVAVVAALAGLARLRPTLGALVGARETSVSHDLVVEQVRSVAKLVSTEMPVRDVVIFEDTWLGSTKRSIVVVTGRVMAGIDLDRGTDVRIDERAKLITIVIPPAEILAAEIVDLRTYDERAGLWNPFRPGDRDRIHREVRRKIVGAAEQAGIVRHAEESAERLLTALLEKDGYSVLVLRTNQLLTPPTS